MGSGERIHVKEQGEGAEMRKLAEGKWSGMRHTLTCEEMFVDACDLDVRLCRARHDQAVDDALRDSLRHRMPQQALHHHGPRLRKQRIVSGARHVRERRVLQRRRGSRGEAQYLAGPAVDRALELRCRVLCGSWCKPRWYFCFRAGAVQVTRYAP